MPENSDLSLMTDKVGKGWFSMLCHGSELIGSGMIERHAGESDNACDKQALHVERH
jgi:hypothetical protein